MLWYVTLHCEGDTKVLGAGYAVRATDPVRALCVAVAQHDPDSRILRVRILPVKEE